MENKSLKEDDFGQGFKESILTLYKKQLWTDAKLIIDLPKDRDNQVSSLKRVCFASSKKRHKKNTNHYVSFLLKLENYMHY